MLYLLSLGALLFFVSPNLQSLLQCFYLRCHISNWWEINQKKTLELLRSICLISCLILSISFINKTTRISLIKAYFQFGPFQIKSRMYRLHFFWLDSTPIVFILAFHVFTVSFILLIISSIDSLSILNALIWSVSSTPNKFDFYLDMGVEKLDLLI